MATLMSRKNKEVEHYFSVVPKCDDSFGIIKTTLRGRNLQFLTSSNVFSKRRVDLGTRVLIEAMFLPKTGNLLDIGCGYGAVGITAALLNPGLSVFMTDVNVRAVRLTRRNAEVNRVSNVDVRLGYLYEPVQELQFDCVLSNPPVSAGMETVKAIISGASNVMASGGSFQMVVRSKIGAKTLPNAFIDAFGNCEILARESGYRVLMGKN